MQLLPIPSLSKATIEKKERPKNNSTGLENELKFLKETNQTLVNENQALKESDAVWNVKLEEMKTALAVMTKEKESTAKENEALKESDVARSVGLEEIKAALAVLTKEKESTAKENEALKESDVVRSVQKENVALASNQDEKEYVK